MGPPRLTVVHDATAGPEVAEPSGHPSRRADGSAMASDQVQASMPPHDAGSSSPVHELLASIEAGATDERRERLRVIEALIFAAAEPVGVAELADRTKLSADDVAHLLDELMADYAGRGVNLVRVAGKWTFRTADDLAYVLERQTTEQRRLSKAALETLAIIAYHQPVTRAEIEDIRGVMISKGTLDVLIECGWIRPRGRRRAPGKPLTYGTTSAFLQHFGLDSIKDLPGLADLKSAGLLDADLPPDFKVPSPADVAALMPDELPLEAGDEAEDGADDALELDGDVGDDDGELERDADAHDDCAHKEAHAGIEGDGPVAQ